MSQVRQLGKRYSFVKKVAKMGKVYMITVPKDIGEILHRKVVQVTLETIEDGDNNG